MRQQKTVAEYIVRQMHAWGIDTVFGVPGDTVLPLLASLRTAGSPRFIVCRHAESAALMASAYAKTSGRPAACVADAGPGAVQMLNGVYDARRDRVPLLALTGEPASDRRGVASEGSTAPLYRGATAYNEILPAAPLVPRLLGQALRRMTWQGRPVRFGVPKDLWNEPLREARIAEPPEAAEHRAEVRLNERAVARAAELLQAAERPLLLAGTGAAGAAEPLLRLAQTLQAPVVHTLPASGAIPSDNGWNLGVIGRYGTQAAADAFGLADAICIVGATWWEPEFAAADVKVVQIDIARDHLGASYPVDVGVWGDAAEVAGALADRLVAGDRPRPGTGFDWDGAWLAGPARGGWVEFVRGARAALEAEWRDMAHNVAPPLEPGAVVAAVGRALAPGAIVSVDVGNNTFWFSRYIQGPDIQVLLSGHWRTAGFGLPGAVAAKLAEPRRQVVMISGDGGFGMTMADLLTAVQYELPIVCIVLSDGRYGEEAALQRAQGQAPFGTGLHEPDWAAYARACGAAGYTVNTFDELQGALHEALPALARGQVSVLHVHVARVEPMHPEPQRLQREALLAAPSGRWTS